LPWHRCNAEDSEPLVQGEPVELVFALMPMSNLFDAGHRIRVTVTGADQNTFETPRLDPPPTVSIYRSSEYASFIELPIIPAQYRSGRHATEPLTTLDRRYDAQSLKYEKFGEIMELEKGRSQARELVSVTLRMSSGGR